MASMKSSCQTRWVRITSERHHRKHRGSCSWHNHLKTWAWHPHQRIELSVLAWETLPFVLLCFYVLLSQKQTRTKSQRPAHPEKRAVFAPRQYLSKSPGISVVTPIALLLLGVLYHGDGMSTAPLCTKALGAESIHEVFFLLWSEHDNKREMSCH